MLTNQEMFDRAVKGLRAQGWEPARLQGEGCKYSLPTDDGGELRCAWGHVDPSLGPDIGGTVMTLRRLKIGLAAELDDDGETFAWTLQVAHDGVAAHMLAPKVHMEKKFRELGVNAGLTWPEE